MVVVVVEAVDVGTVVVAGTVVVVGTVVAASVVVVVPVPSVVVTGGSTAGATGPSGSASVVDGSLGSAGPDVVGLGLTGSAELGSCGDTAAVATAGGFVVSGN